MSAMACCSPSPLMLSNGGRPCGRCCQKGVSLASLPFVGNKQPKAAVKAKGLRGPSLLRAALAVPPSKSPEEASRDNEGFASRGHLSLNASQQLLNRQLASANEVVRRGEGAAEGNMLTHLRDPSSDGHDDLVDVACDRTHDNPTLVLMRHGESMWNDLKLFTGDVDIPLTERGVMEALAGGKSVAEIDFSLIFTSRLMRSKQTALLAMTQNAHKAVPVIIRGGYHGKGQTGDANRLRLRAAAAQAMKQAECRMIPVYADPALNERCYGDLQGLNKEAAAKTFGDDVVAKWRRSHDTRPPHGESLKDTWERSLGFYMSTIEPRLDEGKNVLVVAHGNVLRCIISYLCNLSELEMLRLQIATALPYAFSYDLDTSAYAQCCVLPPLDPVTNKYTVGKPMGLTSAVKRNALDSLI